MANFVPIDNIETARTFLIAGFAELGGHIRADVEPARFEHQGDDGKSGEQTISGFLGGLP